MEPKILKGSDVAKAIREDVRQRVEGLAQKHITPCLAILRIGEKADDIAYERGAKKRMEGLNIQVKSLVLPEDVKQEECLQIIEELNQDTEVHGVLILMPLPKHIDEDLVRQTLSPAKDIDGITPGNMAKLYMKKDGMVPCTPKACMAILHHYDIPIEGKRVLIIGRSLIVGKPLAMMLLNENATITIAHSRTEELEKLAREFDMIICAIGRGHFLTEDFVKDGAIVIDVGINEGENGMMIGDVNYDKVAPKTAAITPVPGGVGSVTTTILAQQLIEACEKQAEGMEK